MCLMVDIKENSKSHDLLVCFSQSVRTMSSTDQYVHVFSFDFTKALDSVRHETLMNKTAQLNIPDNIYNWIKAFFEQHFHCTRYAGDCSAVAAVKASVIQGSGLGPASFIVTAAGESHFQICR